MSSAPLSPKEESRSSSIVSRFLIPTLIVVAVVVLARFALTGAREPRPDATEELGPLADPGATYDPVRAGEPLPRRFRQLLPRDGILPVYDPAFVSAAEAGWASDVLVIGVDLDHDARAYPVGFLNSREMVIDRIAGIPVLVTW